LHDFTQVIYVPIERVRLKSEDGFKKKTQKIWMDNKLFKKKTKKKKEYDASCILSYQLRL